MRHSGFLLVILLLSVFVASAQSSDIETICLITDIGRVNDGTFNQSAYDGMLRAVEEYDLSSRFIETQSQTDYETNINTCLEEGFDFIITVGFAMGDATFVAANENPGTYFMGIDAFFPEALPNLVGLQFREDQAGFLAGVIASQMTETNVVAGIYGIDYPALRRFRNGYEQGAKYMNPDIDVRGIYIDDFQAPDRGAAAAIQFIGEGADVIFGAAGPTGSGGIMAAAQAEVLVIGVDQDEYFTTFGSGETPGAEFLITSAIKRVDNGVFDMITAALNGDGFPEDSIYVLDVANEGIGFAPSHDAEVPEEVTAILEEMLVGLGDGSIETGVDFFSGDLLSEVEETGTSTD